MKTERRAQFDQKVQKYAATVTTVSSILSTSRKPRAIWKPDMGSSARKEAQRIAEDVEQGIVPF